MNLTVREKILLSQSYHLRIEINTHTHTNQKNKTLKFTHTHTHRVKSQARRCFAEEMKVFIYRGKMRSEDEHKNGLVGSVQRVSPTHLTGHSIGIS